MHVLLITLDQFRGDSTGVAGHPLVKTPALDALAAAGTLLSRHYAQAAPCAPGRAALYTGTYQANNRVVANGTPLDDRFDNVARLARRAGYEPTLFGYTDQAIDPRRAAGPKDPLLSRYQGVLPGFAVELDLSVSHAAWLDFLERQGYSLPSRGPEPAEEYAYRVIAGEPGRSANHSLSAFTTDRAIEWLRRQDQPWFAHLSFLRPHPPYAAAGAYSTLYDPADVGWPISPVDETAQHRIHRAGLRNPMLTAPTDEAALRHMRAQYFGMISEVDANLGRLWQALRQLGFWDDTLIVVTADHGEQLGDHGLKGKYGFFESSYHVNALVRDPRFPTGHGRAIEEFTENVDFFPTIAEYLGADVPAQCDGYSLIPMLRGEQPVEWREAAHWEYDWRSEYISSQAVDWPSDRRLERQNLAVLRNNRAAYVQFANGDWLAFDLEPDPTWRTPLTDTALVLPLAQDMLVWRATHTERTLTGMLCQDGGVGRLPPDAFSRP